MTKSVPHEARNSVVIVRVVVIVAVVVVLTEAHEGEHRASEGQGLPSSKFIIDADHISEHLRGHVSSFIHQMSEGELEFYYFELHDTDNNTKLDGLEILKALYHELPVDEADAKVHGKSRTTGKTEQEAEEETRERRLKYYTDIIGQLLRQADVDSDGYLAYPEYITAIKREVSRGGVKISRGKPPEEGTTDQHS